MKTFLISIFILTLAQAHAQDSFLKACKNELTQNQAIKNNLKWLKAFYKTKKCTTLAENISKIRSLNEIILPSNGLDSRIKNSWTDQFPYLYGIYFSDTANDLFNSLDIDREKTFIDVSLYRDFKNIQNVTLTLEYPYFRNHRTCKVLELFPHLKTVTIEWHTLLEEESDNCLSKSKINGVIIRDSFYDSGGARPKTKIIGMENYSADLKQLYRYPDVSYLGISSYSTSQGKLEELSGRINITHFSMSAKNTKGISNLGNLVNLSYLSLTCVAPDDTSEQQPCTGASFLKDINFVKKLRWLKNLKLNNHQLADIAPIKGLKHLELLELRGNSITRLPDLKELTKLKVLDLGGNKIKDLTHIQHLKGLRLLDLSSNQISDFSPLSGLDKLTHLNLSNNIFQTSLSSFIPPTSLRVLALNGASPEADEDFWTSHNEDFVDEVIIGMTHHFQSILVLDFEYSDRTYRPFLEEGINLQNFSNIEILSLRNNNFKSIPQLNYMKRLKYLDLDGNHIKSIANDVLFSELIALDLSNNKMERFPTLHQFPKLKKLDINNNKIKKIEQFNPTKSLTMVALNHNLLTDVKILAKPIYRNLRLELQENPVVDKKSHCPFNTLNKDLNWYCNQIVNKPDNAEKLD